MAAAGMPTRQISARMSPLGRKPPEEEQAHGHAGELAQHGGDGGAGHAQGGEGAGAEDEEGIHDQVDHGAHPLDHHGPHRVAAGQEDPLGGELHGHPHRYAGDNGEVGTAGGGDGGVGGEKGHEGPGEEQAEGEEKEPAQQIEKDAVEGHRPGFGPVSLAQALGEEGVKAHSGPHAHGHHEHLHRVGQGQGLEGRAAEPGDEHGIHQVVEGLDEHREHHGPGHPQQQRPHRHGAHFGVVHVPASLFRSAFRPPWWAPPECPAE